MDKNANIIDIVGGDSFLIDHLLALGYQNITILDISDKAIEKAKNRLGNKSNLVKWIVTDITTFTTNTMYDVWHDRAIFHLLSKKKLHFLLSNRISDRTYNIEENRLMNYNRSLFVSLEEIENVFNSNKSKKLELTLN